MSQVQVAMLGAGGRGRGTVRNWTTDPNCQLRAIVDPSQESLDKMREQLGPAAAGVSFTTDVSGWLKSPNAELVVINSWDVHHAENAIACFEAGLHVQVAKPMTQTIAEADAVYQAWRKSGRIGIVDMQIRASLLLERAMQLIADGAIGTPRMIVCQDYVGRSGAFFRQRRSRRRDSIKSLALAKGVHFLDLCNMLMQDDPVRVFASGGLDVFGGDKPDDLHCNDCDEADTCQFYGPRATIGGESFPVRDSLCVFASETDVTDNFCGVIDYRNGGRISYTECYFTPEYETVYDVIGEKAALRLRYAMDNRLWLELRDRRTTDCTRMNIHSSGAHGGGDVLLARQTVAAVRDGRQIEPSIRDGRQAVALAEALDRSIETRQPVPIPPLPGD